MAANENHYTLPLPVFDKPVKLLIVVAPYYRDIADWMIAGAKAVAAKAGAEVEIAFPLLGASPDRRGHRCPRLTAAC